MSETTARTILECLRRYNKVTTTQWEEYDRVTGETVQRIRAISSLGEAWEASGDDFYKAVCALAEMMGWDLEG